LHSITIYVIVSNS